jgi:hypothetical protein
MRLLKRSVLPGFARRNDSRVITLELTLVPLFCNTAIWPLSAATTAGLPVDLFRDAEFLRREVKDEFALTGRGVAGSLVLRPQR